MEPPVHCGEVAVTLRRGGSRAFSCGKCHTVLVRGETGASPIAGTVRARGWWKERRDVGDGAYRSSRAEPTLVLDVTRELTTVRGNGAGIFAMLVAILLLGWAGAVGIGATGFVPAAVHGGPELVAVALGIAAVVGLLLLRVHLGPVLRPVRFVVTRRLVQRREGLGGPATLRWSRRDADRLELAPDARALSLARAAGPRTVLLAGLADEDAARALHVAFSEVLAATGAEPLDGPGTAE